MSADLNKLDVIEVPNDEIIIGTPEELEVLEIGEPSDVEPALDIEIREPIPVEDGELDIVELEMNYAGVRGRFSD